MQAIVFGAMNLITLKKLKMLDGMVSMFFGLTRLNVNEENVQHMKLKSSLHMRQIVRILWQDWRSFEMQKSKKSGMIIMNVSDILNSLHSENGLNILYTIRYCVLESIRDEASPPTAATPPRSHPQQLENTTKYHLILLTVDDFKVENQDNDIEVAVEDS